jgi:hypothetical protein
MLRPNKKICAFTVTRPGNPIFSAADPNLFYRQFFASDPINFYREFG